MGGRLWGHPWFCARGMGDGWRGLWDAMSPPVAQPLRVMLRRRPGSVALATGPQRSGCCGAAHAWR